MNIQASIIDQRLGAIVNQIRDKSAEDLGLTDKDLGNPWVRARSHLWYYV